MSFVGVTLIDASLESEVDWSGSVIINSYCSCEHTCIHWTHGNRHSHFYRRTIVFDINRVDVHFVQLKVMDCQSSLIISEHIECENEMMISLQTDD